MTAAGANRGRRRASAWCALAFAGLAQAAAVPDRHPLELESLQHPEAALEQLTPLIADAEARADALELARLQLARANACRVLADWTCQRDAGRAAREAADRADQPLLAIRALIAESRGHMARQDYSPGGHLLAEAERRLARTPAPALLADVLLAYSSMSHALGRQELARDYAARGLVALGPLPEPLIRARLLRNRGRAQANLGDTAGARDALQEARKVAEAVQDPKLSAELDLELARLARLEGDLATQRSSAERVLASGERFANPQLLALGHEMLGLAALSEGDSVAAERALQVAQQKFEAARLEGDERRVLRELLRIKLARDPNRNDLGSETLRLLQLDEVVERRERALAGDEFDARLRYANQEFDLQRLAKEAEVASERASALETSNRMRLLLLAIGTIGLAVIAILLVLQRRAHGQLAQAFAQLKQRDAALEASEQRLRAVTDNTPAIISHVDRNERYTFANAFMNRMFAGIDRDIVGRSVREVRGEALYQTLAPHIAAALRGENVSFEGQTEIGGKQYYYQTSYIPERDRDGAVVGFFAMTFDITRLKLAEQQLEREARFDALTGVANRRHFEERLALAITRGRHQPVALAVLYLDIDHLKPINDRHGHAVGDIVIREFASRVQRCVRDGDLVARLGGDEFVVLSEHLETAQAVEAGERCARLVLDAMEAPVDCAGMALRVGTSIGVAVTQAVASADTVIAEADRALYAAKAAGRNTWRRA
jgi:diguanylate cyclase (GGDEF)-like protein/PAS domain S-box-containing protein